MNTNTIFYNSDYIVIEYIDLIKSPYLVLLSIIKNNDKLREILKIEQIEFLDDASLCEWYINRKHQNFFIDLNRYPDIITDKQMDEILNEQMTITTKFYENTNFLNLVDMLRIVPSMKIVNGIIIYNPHESSYASEELKNEVGTNFTFMNDWNEVMEKAGSNSTYFISDIDKIILMKEKGILKCSSVTLPIEYRYNRKNMKEMKYDLKEIYKECPFKISFFNSCTKPEE